MGVSKWIGTFIDPIPVNLAQMRATCGGVAIDMNQFVHVALETVAGECDKSPVINEIKTYHFSKTKEEILKMFESSCKIVLKGVFDELSQITRLERIYISMDGIPCYGKIQNQLLRRKKSDRFVDKDGKLVFSKGMTLPSTPIMQIFTLVLRNLLEQFLKTYTEVSVVMSLSDISGEGEHKSLDFVRYSPYTTFSETSSDASILVWSNDSDSIISLLHQSYVNIYIMTEVVKGQDRIPKCVDLSVVRQSMCIDNREVLNSALLLAFAGNDYLPEMLNSLNLGEFYKICREICKHHLTKEDRPKNIQSNIKLKVERTDEVTKDDSVSAKEPEREIQEMYGYGRVIDFEGLKLFFRQMTDIELGMYMAERKEGNYVSPPQFKGNTEEYLSNPVSAKAMYYGHIYKTYYPNVEPTNEELFQLEMDMALQYLKVYVWYYYYQSGFHVGEPLDKVYYSYSYPPLYNSLFIILDRKKNEHLVHFDMEHNSNLRPVQRDLSYFEKLPVFYELHHYMVLQNEDLQALYPTGLSFNDPSHEAIKAQSVVKDSTFQVRIRGKSIEVYQRIEIDRLMVKYPTSIRYNLENRTITRGNVLKEDKRKNMNRFRLVGKATFE
jgi:hypothetical protein